MEVPDGQHTRAGWEIAVFRVAPEIRLLEDSTLSQSHQAIDGLGCVFGDERQRLVAAWLQVHKAQQAREEEWRCAAEPTGSSVAATKEAAAEERHTAAADTERELELRERELALRERKLALTET